MSARLARSITDSLPASVNRLYFHSGRIVRWKNKLRTVVCSCDLDLEILCEGNQRLSRCTTKVGSTRQPGVVTPAATRSGDAQNGRGASQLLGTATSTGELQQRELVLIQDLHVIRLPLTSRSWRKCWGKAVRKKSNLATWSCSLPCCKMQMPTRTGCTRWCLYALVLSCSNKDFRVSRLCVSEQMVRVIFGTLRLCS